MDRFQKYFGETFPGYIVKVQLTNENKLPPVKEMILIIESSGCSRTGDTMKTIRKKISDSEGMYFTFLAKQD